MMAKERLISFKNKPLPVCRTLSKALLASKKAQQTFEPSLLKCLIASVKVKRAAVQLLSELQGITVHVKVGGITMFALYQRSLTFCSATQPFIWCSRFPHRCAQIWNSIPLHICRSQTYSSFRRHLKTHDFISAHLTF